MGPTNQYRCLALRRASDGNLSVSIGPLREYKPHTLIASKFPACRKPNTCRHELGLSDLQRHYHFCSDILCDGRAETIQTTCEEGGVLILKPGSEPFAGNHCFCA